jgi:hypothetical protein
MYVSYALLVLVYIFVVLIDVWYCISNLYAYILHACCLQVICRTKVSCFELVHCAHAVFEISSVKLKISTSLHVMKNMVLANTMKKLLTPHNTTSRVPNSNHYR